MSNVEIYLGFMFQILSFLLQSNSQLIYSSFVILRIFCEISSFFSLFLYFLNGNFANFHIFSYQLSERQIAEEGENDMPF